MASPRVYLDHNATAPLRPRGQDGSLAALACAAQPVVGSCGRAPGSRARRGRQAAGGVPGRARPERVVFTSGATEAAHLALSPDLVADGRRGFDRLLVGATEHAAVLRGHRFGGERSRPCRSWRRASRSRGAFVGARPRRSLRRGGPGRQQRDGRAPADRRDRGAACEARRRRGLRCRSGGGADRLRRRSGGCPARLGHKLGGLAGAGAVVMLSDRVALGAAVLRGGGQERGSGPEPRTSRRSRPSGPRPRRRGCEAGLMRRCATVSRRPAAHRARCRDVRPRCPRLPNTSAFAVPGVSAETPADVARSRRDRGLVRVGLRVGQGRSVACP